MGEKAINIRITILLSYILNWFFSVFNENGMKEAELSGEGTVQHLDSVQYAHDTVILSSSKTFSCIVDLIAWYLASEDEYFIHQKDTFQH